MRNKEICNFFLLKKNVLDYVPINKIGGGHPLKNNLKKKSLPWAKRKLDSWNSFWKWITKTKTQ